MTGDEMVGWYHQLNGHGSEENPGDRDCLLQFTGSQRVGHILTSKQQSQTENEMVGWHHQLNGHEFEQLLPLSDE